MFAGYVNLHLAILFVRIGSLNFQMQAQIYLDKSMFVFFSISHIKMIL
jgi:hypothetical protein